jgi:hypothetical protein
MRINSSCLRLPLGNRRALAVLVLVAELGSDCPEQKYDPQTDLTLIAPNSDGGMVPVPITQKG